ncbi:MAG: cell division protein FtsZ [Chloroflexi bacterium]|nr:cell division protein FtsZ [Chloroflexota bacterium]
MMPATAPPPTRPLPHPAHHHSDEMLAAIAGRTRLKVLGLGGGGSNAVNRMIELGIIGVDFVAANTDHQVLKDCLAPKRIHLGPRLTRGLGAGGNPVIGEQAALESRNEIADALEGTDMVFLTAGMGGGTGTGAIAVAAETAQSLGAVTIAVVTTPFLFEGSRRSKAALDGIARLSRYCDTLITVPNDRLLQILPRDVTLDIAFRIADDVLRQTVQGIAELITRPGLINVDFANIRHLMKLKGGALLAIGQGRGANKALDAVHNALNSQLIDLSAIDQAAGVLAHFTGADDLSLYEVSQAISLVHQKANPQAEIVFGATTDPTMAGKAQVILVATGVGGRPLEEIVPGAEALRQRAPAVPVMEAALAPRRLAHFTAPGAGRLPVEGPTRGAEAANPAPRQPVWVVAPDSGLDPDNLELPAFLRKERYTPHPTPTR